MLVVTVSGTLSLYLGSGRMMRSMYPYDARRYMCGNGNDATDCGL
ncbi:MAG: hypothetical protein R2881_03300 [Eubacteriales bacterium]